MMTFYLGKEIKRYEKKFKSLIEHFMNKAGSSSNSAIFRYIVDILYDEISKVKENNKVAKKNGI